MIRANNGNLGWQVFSKDFLDDLGARFVFKWDTREHYYYPYFGHSLDFVYENHGEWLGNDNAYSSLYLDGRYFYSLDNTNRHILASRLVGRYLIDAEDAPSNAYTIYGRQGKEVQRGYEAGEHVASHMVNLEVEYRHQLSTGSEYLDNSILVAFTGIGKSFGYLPKIGKPKESFGDAEWLSMIGVGYHYQVLPYERINMKVDVSVNSDGDWIAYFGVRETF